MEVLFPLSMCRLAVRCWVRLLVWEVRSVGEGLMFFKNALHAHVFWDFPPAMVVAMLTRAPELGISWCVGWIGDGVSMGVEKK